MTPHEAVLREVRQRPRTWLVTGAAGFIGSNLTEHLLRLGQRVVGLDNFSTGSRENLDDVRELVGPQAWSRLTFVEGDIRDLATCQDLCARVDVVLHQAALGSVPRSIENPLATHQSNVDGFLNILLAARDARVRRFVFAASSSTYGDHPVLPRVEERIGRPLSPYAVTKYVNELYAGVFERTYGMQTIGLRYFNVFGRRQNPDGPYAAVIPKWVASLLSGEECVIYGDGENSRDFCHVDNVAQANLLAALAEGPDVTGQVYNVACGERTTLNELFGMIRDGLSRNRPELADARPRYLDFRPGDVRHSHADLSKITRVLGYAPTRSVQAGLRETLDWYSAAFGGAPPVSTGRPVA
jgi:UDP-N-acetylglucosamine 4-epimerase